MMSSQEVATPVQQPVAVMGPECSNSPKFLNLDVTAMAAGTATSLTTIVVVKTVQYSAHF